MPLQRIAGKEEIITQWAMGEVEAAGLLKMDFLGLKNLTILSKAVAMDPEYSPEPSIRTQSGQEILVVKGKYATKPLPMTFEYEYINRDGDWKLLKLVVRMV